MSEKKNRSIMPEVADTVLFGCISKSSSSDPLSTITFLFLCLFIFTSESASVELSILNKRTCTNSGVQKPNPLIPVYEELCINCF